MAVPNPEPTIADVLAQLHIMEVKAETRDSELRRDMVNGFLVVARQFEDVNRRFEDVNRRLTTLFDELAAFRAEYNAHTHGED